MKEFTNIIGFLKFGILFFGFRKKKTENCDTALLLMKNTEETTQNNKFGFRNLDYTYDNLLIRAYCILKKNNPELKGEKRKTILKPPQVAREGSKRTSFINFQELCILMGRPPDHVMQFLLSEIGSSGSLDGSMCLIIKGRYLPKDFERVLRRYMLEYVLCNSCKSAETSLDKDQNKRLMFIKCCQCKASRTVSNIKSGFQARTTSRRSDRTS